VRTLPNKAERTSTGQHCPSGPVTALMAWAELSWARAYPPSTQAAAGLSASQRLLLAMVLFGPANYRQAADRVGLTPAEVSRHCTAALRQLTVACRSADAAHSAGTTTEA